MAQDEATYAEHFEEANASFKEKEKKLQEETDNKVKLIRQNLSKDYDEKAKKQEERFTTKRDRKSTRLNSSHSGESRMPSSA